LLVAALWKRRSSAVSTASAFALILPLGPLDGRQGFGCGLGGVVCVAPWCPFLTRAASGAKRREALPVNDCESKLGSWS